MSVAINTQFNHDLFNHGKSFQPKEGEVGFLIWEVIWALRWVSGSRMRRLLVDQEATTLGQPHECLITVHGHSQSTSICNGSKISSCTLFLFITFQRRSVTTSLVEVNQAIK